MHSIFTHASLFLPDLYHPSMNFLISDTMGKQKARTLKWNGDARKEKKRKKTYEDILAWNGWSSCLAAQYLNSAWGYEAKRYLVYIGFPSTPEVTVTRIQMDETRISPHQPKNKGNVRNAVRLSARVRQQWVRWWQYFVLEYICAFQHALWETKGDHVP